MSTVSVIVPAYKVEEYLARCIDSILKQTFTDYDLVLIDDGSPDNCGSICDDYNHKDTRVHVIHKENGGLSDARNAGIEWALKNSDSKWITFIDSDDWVHPTYLQDLLRAVLEYNVQLAVAKYIRVDSFQIDKKYTYSANCYDTQELFVNERVNMVIVCGKLFSKTDFQTIRFPVGKLHEDEFTTYKILFKHEKVTLVDYPLYYYYVNPHSIINSTWSLSRLVSLDAFQEQIDFFKNNHYQKAYESSANALYISCAGVIAKLREFYPQKRLLRIKNLLLFYLCKVKCYGRFVTQKEKERMRSQVHPKFDRLCKWIRKKKSNLTEILMKK